jgi:hypothetical protein
MRRFGSQAFVVAAIMLLAYGAMVQFSRAGKAQGGQAQDIAGGFVSFEGGVLTINVKGGRLHGEHKFQIPDGIPVMVYTSAGHPTTNHAPGGLEGVARDTRVQVTVDTRDYIVRVTVGDTNKKKSSSGT